MKRNWWRLLDAMAARAAEARPGLPQRAGTRCPHCRKKGGLWKRRVIERPAGLVAWACDLCKHQGAVAD
jgi:hypothetical protein